MSVMHRVIALALVLLAPAVALADKPDLVVFISVDQLRGDLPLKYRDSFGKDGFRRFFDHGVVYTDAHYRHATTMTGCGHAALATGANPRENGIVANTWMDPKTGGIMYCVQDQDHRLLGTPTKPNAGTSPRNLKIDTIGDALIAATGGRARVFSVSGKDRSAILMGGHRGKAFWISRDSGTFVTSDYYYPACPAWAAAFNASGPLDRYAGATWDVFAPEQEYVCPDVREVELSHSLLGNTFPHPLTGLSGKALYTAIYSSPFSDELVITFAKSVIENEQLGKRGVTDMLMLNLSATDVIGHAFGPESREQEDNQRRLDAQLASFFQYLDSRYGEDGVLVALSADHGVDGNPGGKPAGQLNPAELARAVSGALEAQFGADDYLLPIEEPYLTFTPAVREERGNDIAKMQDVAAVAALDVPGVAYAIPAHRIGEGKLDSENPIMDRILRSYRPGVSGDVFIVPNAYCRVYAGTPSTTATHGTPYSYDTYVAMMFYGPEVPALGETDRSACPESIAAPSSATAPVLHELVNAES